jgi:quaternary ammonium compound-resistance protein SugE
VAWLVLVVSGGLEMVWAAALSASHGPAPVEAPPFCFVVAMVVSLAGLSYAMTSIPVGTAYAVWVGIGATLTLIWGLVTRQEKSSWGRIGLLGLLIVSLVGPEGGELTMAWIILLASAVLGGPSGPPPSGVRTDSASWDRLWSSSSPLSEAWPVLGSRSRASPSARPTRSGQASERLSP